MRFKHIDFFDETIYQNFLANTIRDGDCLLWLGSVSNHGKGYPHGRAGGQLVYIHRYVALYNIPEAEREAAQLLVTIHSCDCNVCIAPIHLSMGTHGDNLRDACNKGHRTTALGGNTRLSTDDVLTIRNLYDSGMTPAKIANLYPVTRQNIRLIGERRTWINV